MTLFYEVKSKDPITYQELKAWSDLTGRKLSSFEISTIMALDRAYLTAK